MSDEDWLETKIIAKGQGLTVSEWIRHAMTYGSGGEDSEVIEELRAAGLRPPPSPPTKWVPE